MSLFAKLFSARPDPLLERASMLVGAATVMGMGSYTEFGKKVPLVFELDTEQWDWVFTIAGVFVATTRLNNLGVSEARQQRMLPVVFAKLKEWKPDGPAGFEDCKNLFENVYDDLARLEEYQRNQQFLASDAVGVWMTWNLVGHEPASEQERKLVRMVGIAVTHTFFSWWDLP